jgi:hypothetical protein
MPPSDKEFKTLRERVDGAIVCIDSLQQVLKQSSWIQKNPVFLWLITVSVPIAAMCLTLVFGVLPYVKDYAQLQIGKQVSDAVQPQNQKLDKAAQDIEEIKAKFELYDPMLQDYWRTQFKNGARLTPEAFKSSLPALDRTITAAKTAKVSLDPVALGEVGKRAFDLAAKQPDQFPLWQTATHLIDYRSSLNPSPVAFADAKPLHDPTLYHTGPGILALFNYGDVPQDESAVFERLGDNLNRNNPRGDAFVIARGGSVVLDGLTMKNVILENVSIVYHGGPIRMENVYFVNCTFALPQSQIGAAFGIAVLEHPSVVFSG